MHIKKSRMDAATAGTTLPAQLESTIGIGGYRHSNLINRVREEITPDIFVNKFARRILNGGSARRYAAMGSIGISLDVGFGD